MPKGDLINKGNANETYIKGEYLSRRIGRLNSRGKKNRGGRGKGRCPGGQRAGNKHRRGGKLPPEFRTVDAENRIQGPSSRKLGEEDSLLRGGSLMFENALLGTIARLDGADPGVVEDHAFGGASSTIEFFVAGGPGEPQNVCVEKLPGRLRTKGVFSVSIPCGFIRRFRSRSRRTIGRRFKSRRTISQRVLVLSLGVGGQGIVSKIAGVQDARSSE
jgi:hypothetical protein